jgi:hypothetical protein
MQKTSPKQEISQKFDQFIEAGKLHTSALFSEEKKKLFS